MTIYVETWNWPPPMCINLFCLKKIDPMQHCCLKNAFPADDNLLPFQASSCAPMAMVALCMILHILVSCQIVLSQDFEKVDDMIFFISQLLGNIFSPFFHLNRLSWNFIMTHYQCDQIEPFWIAKNASKQPKLTKIGPSKKPKNGQKRA